MLVEHILSPSPEVTPLAPIPSQNPKGGSGPRRVSTAGAELSVFDIHNIFRRRWFLSRAHLLTNVISAQKDEDGNISWVEFTPQYHSHLVKCAVALVPHPVHQGEKGDVCIYFGASKRGGPRGLLRTPEGWPQGQ
jgi:hypothetical protein